MCRHTMTANIRFFVSVDCTNWEPPVISLFVYFFYATITFLRLILGNSYRLSTFSSDHIINVIYFSDRVCTYSVYALRATLSDPIYSIIISNVAEIGRKKTIRRLRKKLQIDDYCNLYTCSIIIIPLRTSSRYAQSDLHTSRQTIWNRRVFFLRTGKRTIIIVIIMKNELNGYGQCK